MIDPRTVVLAQPDEHHLHQAALDLADEARMWLHTPTDHNMVRVKGVLVEMHGEASAAMHTTTVSMLERIGHPQKASLTP